MDCVKAKGYLHPYIDEALSASARREFELHLLSCSECTEEFEQLHSLCRSLRSLPPDELPSGFAQSLHEKLTAEPKPQPASLIQRGWFKGFAAAAILMLVVGIVALGNNTFSFTGNANVPDTLMLAATPTATPPPMSPPPPSADYDSNWDTLMFASELAMENTATYDYGEVEEVYYDMADAAQSTALSEDLLTDDAYSSKTIGIVSEARVTGGSGVAEPRSEQQLERKIIRDANLHLKVDDFNAAYQYINDMATRYGGYVVSGDAVSYDGEKMQRGNIMIRVEAVRLEDALAEIESLGKVENRNIYSQDITMEYYDVAGRLSQYQTQERRLLDLFSQAETVAETVTVERELTRIRTQLDSLSGQLRYYEQMTALSSISVSLYQPDTTTQTVRLSGWPGFTQDIRENFISGINRLISGAYALAMGTARLLPVLLLIVVLLTILVLLIKRWIRRKRN